MTFGLIKEKRQHMFVNECRFSDMVRFCIAPIYPKLKYQKMISSVSFNFSFWSKGFLVVFFFFSQRN